MTITDEEFHTTVEAVARAICRYEGIDPDGYTKIGFMGLFGPRKVNWTGYKNIATIAVICVWPFGDRDKYTQKVTLDDRLLYEIKQD